MNPIRAVLPTGRTRWLLSIGTLIDSFGFGLFVTASVVFFTRSVGLSAGQVGFGMSLAGLVGFAAAIPSGHLADRFGARGVSICMALAQAAAMAAFILVHSFPVFLAVTCLFSCVERGGSTVRQALVGRLFGQGSKVSVQAYLRSLFNVGISAGTLAAGAVLEADRTSLYLTLILANALSFIILAVLTAFLPATPTVPRPAHSSPPRGALRDLPYLSVGLFNGLLALHASVLMVGLPLWITLHTSAPRWTVAGLFLCNTLLTIVFQVQASRGSDTVSGAARAVALSSLGSAGACLLFAFTAGLSVVWAIGLLLAATVVLTIAELWQSAGGWGLSYGLAPDHQQGAYLGAFSLGTAVRDGVGPIIVTSLAISHGAVGWSVLAVMFLFLGAAMVLVTRWALMNKARAEPLTRQ